jgi:hypothetical protein
MTTTLAGTKRFFIFLKRFSEFFIPASQERGSNCYYDKNRFSTSPKLEWKCEDSPDSFVSQSENEEISIFYVAAPPFKFSPASEKADLQTDQDM